MRKKIQTGLCALGLLLILCVGVGATRASASAAVSDVRTVVLTAGDYNATVATEPFEPTNHLVAEEIAARHLNEPFADKMHYVDRALNAGATYAFAVERYFPRVYRAVCGLKTRCDKAAVDSAIRFNPNLKPMFTVTREQNGSDLDLEKACRDVYVALKRSAVKDQTDVRVVLTPDVVAPQKTAEENVALTGLRSRFSTALSGSTAARKHNVGLALKKVNGTVLNPGDAFSFNKTVGARTKANGFEEAKIIVGGEYVTGTGGGVCQASTTVYNCALTAGLTVTAARNHTLEPSYVPPSFDAMVNAGSSDLCFTNTGTTPVFIRAYADDARATVEIYGSALPYRIQTESVVTSRGAVPADSEVVDIEHKYIAAGAPTGERMRIAYGKGSVKSEGYLAYYTYDGKLIRRVKIREDVYAAHSGIVMIAP